MKCQSGRPRGGFQISLPGRAMRHIAGPAAGASAAVVQARSAGAAGTAAAAMQAGLQAMVAQASASWHSAAQQGITDRAAAATD